MRGKSWARMVGVALLLGAAGLLGLRPAGATNLWGADYFPNVPLRTQDGPTVHFYDDLLKGKAVAFNLIFTIFKDVSPLESALPAQVLVPLCDLAGKDRWFYSVTSAFLHDM